jgi:hypothetical protein
MSSIDSTVQIELLKNPGSTIAWITHSKRLIESHLCGDAHALLRAANLLHGTNPWISTLHDVTLCIVSDAPASRKAKEIHSIREGLEGQEPDLTRFLSFLLSDDWWPHDPLTKASLASEKSILSSERDFLKSLERLVEVDRESDEESIIRSLGEEMGRPELIQEIETVANSFDHEFYVNTYESRISETLKSTPRLLCCHYLVFGEGIGLMPRRDFAPFRYLEVNEDVKNAGISAFWHWCAAGKQEGRPTSKSPGNHGLVNAEGIYAQLKRFSVEERKKAWAYNEGNIPESLTIDASVHAKVIDSCKSLELIITFDNFTANAGGVQQCIRDAVKACQAANILPIVLFPACPYPVLRSVSPLLKVAVGNQLLEGCFSIGTLADWLKSSIVAKYSSSPAVSIHSLLGWHIDDLLTLLNRISGKKKPEVCVWLHDHFLFCPSYAAQRNDLEQCTLSDIGSLECRICGYRDEREKASLYVSELLKSISPVFISPSEFMAKRGYDLLVKHYHVAEPVIAVKEHRALNEISRRLLSKPQGCLNIAFLGAPTRMKGWDFFEMLAGDLSDYSGISYYCFSSSPPETWLPIKWVETNSGEALIVNMRKAEIHDAILMSRAPETFGLTAYEALSAGAFIHTHKGSGNIADLVLKQNCGLVHDSYQGLLEAVRSRALEQQIDMYLAKSGEER